MKVADKYRDGPAGVAGRQKTLCSNEPYQLESRHSLYLYYKHISSSNAEQMQVKKKFYSGHRVYICERMCSQ